MANEHTEKRINIQQTTNDILKRELNMIKAIELQITDTQVRKNVHKLYEEIQSTPIGSIRLDDVSNANIEQAISRIKTALQESPESINRAINEAIAVAKQRKFH